MAQSTKTAQTTYGQRLMIDIIEDTARIAPFKPFVFAPKSAYPKDGWKPITFKEISQAINYAAWKIKRTGSPSMPDDSFPTLAYIGPSDIRYVIVLFACIKAGFKVLFISPRNTKEAQQSLLTATNCTVLWHAITATDLVSSWDLSCEMQVVPVPSVETWLSARTVEYPYSKTYEDARWNPAVVLHTSGSTGIPKPILVTQGSFAIADALRQLPDFQGGKPMFQAWKEKTDRIFLPMPLFHAAGLVTLLTMAVYYDVPIALSIPERPLSSDLVIECLKHAGVQGTLLPPSIIEELSDSTEGVAALRNMSIVAFAGGSLTPHIGQRLVNDKVALCNLISSTEYFPYPLHYQNNVDAWQYFIINSKVMGSEWRAADLTEKTYELIVQRNQPSEPGLQSVFYTFPDLNEWSTKDLYAPHPTLPDNWVYRGRADNIIVFSTGEKLNPVSMEDLIMADKNVTGALVVGQGRFQPALILEPAKPCDDEAAERLIDEVWPVIEEANAETVAHGRISRRLIMVAKPDQPFSRAPKGTILRSATIRAYAEQIQALYQKSEDVDTSKPVNLDMTSAKSLTQSIIELLAERVGCRNMTPESDFFTAGLDSLQVSTVAALLRNGLSSMDKQHNAALIAPRAIYANPTAKQLAVYLLCTHGRDEHPSSFMTEGERQLNAMKKLLSQYTHNMPIARPDRPQPANTDQTFLITGTTGSLGAYMLHNLCRLESVKKVVALNRGEDGGKSRHPSISSARGLSTDFSKVEFLGADLSKPDFGLERSKYEELLANTDRIIHNAWPVNFNISVASFEPSIRGVRHLVDFAATATKKVPIIFLSSISTVENWTSKEPVPEDLLEDFDLPNMGYGHSKFVGSRILDQAAQVTGLRTASIRVGQIAGPKGQKGAWNKQEFFPSLVASSVYLGVLPDSLGPFDVIDWIPLEDVANIVLDVCEATTTHESPSQASSYFHLVNPNTVKWGDLYPAIKDYYSGRIKGVVSLEEWVSRLEASLQQADDVEKNPGTKLIDTYRDMLETQRSGVGHVFLAMDKTRQKSPTVRALSPISPSLMVHWCDQWGF